MEFFKKLMTAIRGGSRELGEAVLDTQSIRIYEQEIEDAKEAIKKAESDLTGVMAKDMQAGREIERLEKEAAGYESKALSALDQDNEALAGEVAEKIAELEVELETQRIAKDKFSAHVNSVKEMIKQTHAKIREHEREISMVKTTDNVHKAAKSINQHIDGGSSKMVAAKESLERIKHRQQDDSDRMVASESLNDELSGESLENKLKAAGIGDESDRKKQVLERLKAKRKGNKN
ncbi:MAG: PspA/IM30 family protein [Candidatus Thiodiazotropha sp. (ex Lucinoma annulata)]|nr:PspA/IM30 family protein [Candidatus Thiodiazotropha sp. (ex Lucinoma borealis)]MCU7840685.1 PspA/IM30 family protein [Candidatus Thiodiazotropha sp. (ex Troendleina suluensis)]MCU7854684.1 PspA/IM30 family protein [Candidatus Thiodiazotropha sp. (ex Lucinoma borealis)]MCU7867994.1 PspA/IM30 family protein [Candidatus Thiodiazotropha sp. (ex Lucinoma borealis)]MCU7885292.1 PspA/IM30 family protein [Candidatus Thiodiazotropha sp. (ex Lucinoma annulata)]